MAVYLQIYSTVDSEEKARELAKMLVEKRLAACVQIVPGITSFFWWEGKIDTASEWLLLVKSSKDLYPLLEEALLEMHPYQCPEVVAVEIEHGSQSYLDWLRSELHQGLSDAEK
jgi:periplasmic divalent cation tolerance protein